MSRTRNQDEGLMYSPGIVETDASAIERRPVVKSDET
jgi:hypothetical protein